MEHNEYIPFDADLCPSCNTNPAEEEQPCPYDEDIHNECNYCVCCETCRQHCADDI